MITKTDQFSKTTFTVRREERQVVMERIFDAPPDLVWKTITDPNLIPKWWGPEKYPTTVDKMDINVGGAWRFISKDAEGNEMAFSGVYKEVDPPRRLVQTFNFEPIGPGHESTETMELEETEDGRTRVTMTSVYTSLDDLDGQVGSGMEGGARETWERLASLIAIEQQVV
jgi:uncharacterized protein YndB with AHSA1/START domain